jgi:hypothetical protein
MKLKTLNEMPLKKARLETGVSNLNYHDKPITSLDSLYQSYVFYGCLNSTIYTK